ncbi:aminopeptidase N-like [Salmo trutta]|uniref:aminopeptidase N-like n=1 Tax=Salmo trutta TaxID=8032 RepID=UPI00112FD536|nr:aminopeptidase N-like [Salmo trutta]
MYALACTRVRRTSGLHQGSLVTEQVRRTQSGLHQGSLVTEQVRRTSGLHQGSLVTEQVRRTSGLNQGSLVTEQVRRTSGLHQGSLVTEQVRRTSGLHQGLLACTRVPWLLNRYLNYCLDPEKIRKQDSTFTIVYIAGNVVGQSLAWDFVRTNWDHLFNDYGGGSLSFARLIEGITRRFSSEFELKQLQQFIEENAEQGFGSATLAVDQALERTKANMKWVAENKEDILTWFTVNSA